jgi:sphinganine-1-phosphate aldolase
MRKTLPASGQPWSALEPTMEAMTKSDIDWRRGRSPMYVFYTTDSVYDVATKAFFKYFTENGLGAAKAFLGVGQMEREILEMGLSLFHAPAEAVGTMTTGGTESLLLAIKTCRDWTRFHRPGVTKPNIVAPMSVHPAFDKAAHLMNLEVRRTPLKADCSANPAAMAAAIDDQTMMLVGSAPCFPHGIVDPISELSVLGVEQNLWLHVDACVGGYLAPFARQLGYPVPEFDFGLPGVWSLSADLHKFGHCPKPASTVFYRNPELHSFQKFDNAEWTGGRMITQTYVGTRPGGAIAAAWAVMHHLGEAGYLDVSRRLLEMSRAYVEGIDSIAGLKVVGQPHLSIVSYQSTDPTVAIAAVADKLREKGWLIGMTRQPSAIVTMLSLLHEPVREEYLADLREVVDAVRAAHSGSAIDTPKTQPTYS